MKRLVASIVRSLMSPAELVAVRALLAERRIASSHRCGLKHIRKHVLTRPAKLNLGSGRFRKNGFLNVDAQPGGDVTLDLRRGLPFESDCCSLIFSEHCFEHFDYPEPIGYLLRDCFRVLEPGGTLQFSVPDTEWPLVDYRDGPQSPYFTACVECGWHPAQCTTRMEHINYHFRQDSEHRFAYDFETADKILRAAGFVDIQQRRFDPLLDSEHRRIGSLFVSARKPRSTESADGRVK